MKASKEVERTCKFFFLSFICTISLNDENDKQLKNNWQAKGKKMRRANIFHVFKVPDIKDKILVIIFDVSAELFMQYCRCLLCGCPHIDYLESDWM